MEIGIYLLELVDPENAPGVFAMGACFLSVACTVTGIPIPSQSAYDSQGCVRDISLDRQVLLL